MSLAIEEHSIIRNLKDNGIFTIDSKTTTLLDNHEIYELNIKIEIIRKN